MIPEIDSALYSYCSNIVVSNQPVFVRMSGAGKKKSQTPCITIQMIDIREEKGKSVFRELLKFHQTNEGIFIPSLAGYDLYYQVDTYTKTGEEDREIVEKILQTLPARGIILSSENNRYDLKLIEFRVLDQFSIHQFRKAFTYQIGGWLDGAGEIRKKMIQESILEAETAETKE